MTIEALRSMVEKGFRAKLCRDKLEVSGPQSVLAEARPFAQDIKCYLSMALDRSWPEGSPFRGSGLEAWLLVLEWSLKNAGSPLSDRVRLLREAAEDSRSAYLSLLVSFRADAAVGALASSLAERHKTLTGLELFDAAKNVFLKRPTGADSAFD